MTQAVASPPSDNVPFRIGADKQRSSGAAGDGKSCWWRCVVTSAARRQLTSTTTTIAHCQARRRRRIFEGTSAGVAQRGIGRHIRGPGVGGRLGGRHTHRPERKYCIHTTRMDTRTSTRALDSCTAERARNGAGGAAVLVPAGVARHGEAASLVPQPPVPQRRRRGFHWARRRRRFL